MPVYGEEILGQRCTVTFRSSQKLQQASTGRVTEYQYMYKAKICGGGETSSSISLRQHCVVFDNGNELWMALDKEDVVFIAEEDESTEPPTKKLRNCSNNNSNDANIPLDALKDALPRIVAFLDEIPERSSLTRAHSHLLLDAVELRAKVEWAHIVEQHGVDDEFENRVSELTNQIPRQPAYQRGQQLLQLYRCRVAAAKRTHLFTLVGPPPPLDQEHDVNVDGCTFLALNQSKNRLLSLSVDVSPDVDHIRIWNLASQDCICSFTWQNPDNVFDVHYFDDQIVVCTDETFRVFHDETGSLLHEVQSTNKCRSFFRQGRNMLFSSTGDGERGIYSLNVSTGCVQKSVELEDGSGIDKILIAGVCDDKWLVFHVTRSKNANLPSGTYVFDLENSSKKHFLELADSSGSMDVKQCVHSPTTFYASLRFDELLIVLELSDGGELLRERSVSVIEPNALVSLRARSRLFIDHAYLHEVLIPNTNDRNLADCLVPYNLRVLDTGNEHLLSDSRAFPPGRMRRVVTKFATNEKQVFVRRRPRINRHSDAVAGETVEVYAYLADTFANFII